jgi:nitroimidazol reductase NimA-like FMN-containing flavoprotein (pyridoxamine 5'-phosphate oxidase superfamily)
MSSSNGTPRTRTRTHTRPLKPVQVQYDLRSYVVTDDEHNTFTFHRARFLVTDDGELAILRLTDHGRDEYVVALYADGGWRSVVVDGADELPAGDEAEEEARRAREARRNPRLPLDE